MGIDRLEEEFGGRVCFWNPTDIQTVMLTGTKEEIENYTTHMIKKLDAFD